MCLLDEVDEALSSNEALKEGLILAHILHIVLKVEDFIGTAPFEGCLVTWMSQLPWELIGFRRVVEVLKGVDQEDKEVKELLLNL